MVVFESGYYKIYKKDNKLMFKITNIGDYEDVFNKDKHLKMLPQNLRQQAEIALNKYKK